MKTLCLAVLAVLLVAAQAAQVFSSSELAARVSIEADDSMHPLNAEDVITRADFSPAEFEGLQSLTQREFWDSLETQLLNSDQDVALAALHDASALLEAEPAKAEPAKAEPSKADPAKAKEAGKKDGKEAGKKAPAKPKKLSITNDVDLLELAKQKSPAEEKAKVLDAKAFAKDQAYEFINLPLMPDPPVNTTEVVVKGEKARKVLLKKLAKEGRRNMKMLKKLRKKAKKLIAEKEWDDLKAVAKKIEKFEGHMEQWVVQRDAALYLGNATVAAEGWKDHHFDFLDNINAHYVKKQAADTLRIRKQFEKYLKGKKLDKALHMKVQAMQALARDLNSLKGKAMKVFAAKFKAALIKKYGQKKIERAIKRGQKAYKRALKKLAKKGKGKGKKAKKGKKSKKAKKDKKAKKGKKDKKAKKGKKDKKGKKAKKAKKAKKPTPTCKYGDRIPSDPRKLLLKYLKGVTKCQLHKTLLAVAAHLPTVGPYIRAGVVPEEAGRAALPIIRRW